MEDVRGRRLLADLNHAFKKDPLIDEYDFLPITEPKNNMSPLLLVDHKLGLEMWSVRLLFRYAYTCLLNWRNKKLHAVFIEPQEQICLSRAVLMINPDCYSVWNIRKELMENGDLALADDLRLSQLILTKFPKCSEAFCHRRWIFQKLLNQCLSSSNDSSASSGGQGENPNILLSVDGIDIAFGTDASLSSIVNPAEGAVGNETKLNTTLSLASSRLLWENLHHELNICEQAADHYASNYYAWSHREWIVQHCFNCSLHILLSELERTQTWTMKHVSDHSGFHYRQFLLTNLSQRAARLHRQYARSLTSLLEAERTFLLDLIHSFPDHEALWYHRKFVFHAILLTNADATQSIAATSPVLFNGVVAKNDGLKRSRLEHCKTPDLLVEEELQATETTLNQAKDAYQKTLAKRYIEWVKRTFPINSDVSS